jgi:hypothetical protein
MSFSTPLLDYFRRGDVDRDLRLLAARGAFATRAQEQAGLLMLLVSDADPDVAQTAEATLKAVPPEVLTRFLARSDVSTEMRSFFAARGIEPAASPDADGEEAAPLVGGGEAAESPEGEDEKTTVQRIAAMSVAQRVVTAMKGTREERAILIRDSNKLVNAAVLSSPKLTETEVESIAKMTSVSEEVLRIIGRTRAWMKNYTIVAGLARNAKTPVALSMNLLSRLIEKDLRAITTDRNVPDAVRTAARRKLSPNKD